MFVALPRLTIGRKIYVLIGIGFLGLLGNMLLDSRELGSGLRAQKQIELQHLTELALGIVKEEHATSQSGGVAVSEAQRRALARLAALRYGNNDYFVVQNSQSVVLMHPVSQQLVGKDMSDVKDPNGKRFGVEMSDVVKLKGSGFVEYVWPRAGSDKPQPKLAFVAGFAPWNWSVLTGVYIDELDAQIWVSTRQSILAAGIVLLITLAISILMARGITNPLHQMSIAMRNLARGELDVEIPSIGRLDEVGEMAEAVQVFKTNALARQRLEAEQAELEARTSAQRKIETNKLADDFEKAVGRIIETVAFASSELEVSATKLTATATRSQERATVVAAASEEASTNVGSVASSTEEMTSSVNEISRQVQESARIAHEAVDQAQNTNCRVGELAKAASRIGDVVELINTIAGQTNLLALNATIEAARAGEAGRGFAVVASEVKALAEQTAKATGEISRQITGIQSATEDSVSAIREIGETIGRMSEISSTIASAVEQQGAATQEISRNVQQAAHGTLQVSSNIADVQRGASETGFASSQVLSAAQSLSRDSDRLTDEVSKFLNTVRAA